MSFGSGLLGHIMESFFSKKSGSSNSAGQPALAASDPSVAEDEEKIKQEEKCEQEEGQGPESMGPGMTLQQANAQIRQWKAERGQAQAMEEEEQEEEQEEQEEQEEEEEEEAQQVEKEGSAEQPVVQSKCLKDVRLFRRMERPLPDVIRELGQKVVNAAHQLANSVPASAAQPAATCIASAAQPATSSSGQLAKKRKREHATAGNSAEPPVVFGKLHICCGCMRCKVSEVMIVAAKLWQKAWRGYRTKLLFWRYLHLRIIRRFTTANPDVADFIAKTHLNEPRSLEFD